MVYLTYYYSHVPFVPTPEVVVKRMLELAGVGPQDVVYDLGAGDGRIVIAAVRDFGARKAVGIEIREDLVEEARRKILELGISDRAVVKRGDMFKEDISEATVVTLFLLTSVNERLKPKLEKELRKGTRVVSHEFQIPGWRPKVVETVFDGRVSHTLYLYIVGEQK